MTTSDGALELVRAHRVELGVVGGMTLPPELESEPLVDDEIVLDRADLARRSAAAPEGARRADLDLSRGGLGDRAAVETARRELGLHSAGARAAVVGGGQARRRTGAGIAAISRLALDVELEAGRLVVLDVPRWRLARTISVMHARGVPLTPPAERFLELLRETFAAVEPPPNSNLPAIETELVGRERELAELADLVRSGRLVTLTGAGGSGKTRLAIEVAARLVDDFRDGVYLVDLSALRDPELVPPAIADVLALKDASELDERLRGQRLLLVLDNFEHLLEAAPAVRPRRRPSRTSSSSTTSRVPLRVRGERRYRVEPLAVDDAARSSSNEPVK